MNALQNCPCCGGPGRLKDSQGRQVRQGWVGCPGCGLYISWKISPDGAIRKWNRRARPAVVTNGDRIRVLSDRGLAFWLQAVQSMRHPADEWMRWLAEPDTSYGTEAEQRPDEGIRPYAGKDPSPVCAPVRDDKTGGVSDGEEV